MKYTGDCLKCGRTGGRWIRSCECDLEISKLGHKCKECGHPDVKIMCIHYDFNFTPTYDKNGLRI